MTEGPAEGADNPRIVALDLIRGVAILGILAINIAGFAGPVMATITPQALGPVGWADEAWFALMLVLFEGKMRTLFSLLFGASMALFIERADARGLSGEALQMRRLGWLLLFGYLHYLLLWWGDILFTYALAGLAALALRNAPPKGLALAAVALFASWHMAMAVPAIGQAVREERAITGAANPAEIAAYHADAARAIGDQGPEIASYHSGFFAQIAGKLTERPGEPLTAAVSTMGETLPLMMLGMALYQLGFFGGVWRATSLRRVMRWGLGAGGALTLAFAAWAWHRHYPPILMMGAIAFGLAVPHLLMGLGYAAALVRHAPRLARSRLGQRVVACGRMAFTNYIACTVVMTFCFYGWGLDLFGRVPPRAQGLFVLLGWALMLGWSKPWLARYRQGPLEWAWRSLTLWRALPFRHAPVRPVPA